MTVENTHKLIRLYVPDAVLEAGETFELSDAQLHYLRNVMRISAGDHLRIFDGRSGEWLCEVKEISKKNILVSTLHILVQQKTSPDLALLAAPVKKEAFEWMVEKACELGVRDFQPVLTARTVVPRVNLERLSGIAAEAAEQCERLDVMQVHEPVGLFSILENIPADTTVLFCQERGTAPPILDALDKTRPRGRIAVLVGPEGGFTPEEVKRISGLKNALPVSLGERVLRAETATVAALATVGAWLDARK